MTLILKLTFFQLSKGNKLQWGLINGIVLAASAAFLKTSYTGGLPGYPYRTPNKVYPGTTPSYYKNQNYSILNKTFRNSIYLDKFKKINRNYYYE